MKTKKKSESNPTAHKKAFNRTMKQAHSHMNTPQKWFSSIIHLKPIESVLDVISITIARPIPLIGGGIGMLLLLSSIYITAKYIGYEVSGFEGIAGFIIGWIVGIIFEFSKLFAAPKRK